MSIPVEHIGSERQRIPAVLIKIEKTLGFIKYSPRHTPIKVPLSELQLAPSAFEPFDENVYAHTEVCELGSPTKPWTGKEDQGVSPREPSEIWLTTEATSRKKSQGSESSDIVDQKVEELSSPSACSPSGAWWPGRVLNVHGGFVHVEVAAPLLENGTMDDLTVPHVVRMGSSLLPFRSTIVRLGEVRPLWTGRTLPAHAAAGEAQKPAVSKDPFSEQHVLTTPGVLNRHTVCIPAYLARLATSTDAHSALIKFCDAPCLVQCDPEPFLSHVLVKRILADSASASASGRQTPCLDVDSNLGLPSVAVPANSQTPNMPSWPPACTIAQSPLLNPPNVAGTLSPAGVTDPTLLLEGLPGANGPLVLLHIWSGSPEAIRRAALLELAHVRILVFRYHVMRKLSNGEPGELDLADSTDAPTENGDAPVMHCKPISIPIQANPDVPSPSPAGVMIGYSAQFRIQPQLIGLAIGYRGATIHEARALAGVRNVELLHDGIVRIEAETVEACQAVRNLLDFTEAEIPVSPRLASRLIGSKGMNIRKLAASAGVRRAQLLDPLMRKRRHQQQQLSRQPPPLPHPDHEHPDMLSDSGRDEHHADGDDERMDHTEMMTDDILGANGEPDGSPAITPTSEEEKLPPPAFYLLGTRSSVAKMRLLLEFQADNWNELDELEETRRSLFTQLRQSNQQTARMGSFPPTSDSDAAGPSAAQPGPSGPRGRGRRTSGRGGSTTDDAPERDHVSQQGNFQRPFRGRGRGGLNGRASVPSNRLNSQNEGDAHPDEGRGDAARFREGDESRPVQNGWQLNPPKFGMANGVPQSARARGRIRPRNQPLNS